ncbi:MAG: CBS domain-containing protein [Acetobacteraceae bacterium]
MLVSDVLHGKGHEVIRIRTTDKIADAVARLSTHRIGALIVEDRWLKLVGVFSERDLVNAIARHGPAILQWEVHEIMSSPIQSCRSDDRIDAVLAHMTVSRIRHMPVIDDGHLRGIVSIGDLVKHRLEEKELETNVLLELSRLRG